MRRYYTKKASRVMVEQCDGNFKGFFGMARKYGGVIFWDELKDRAFITTQTGDSELFKGDFIVTEISGAISICKPDVFDEIYDPVGEGE